ncbi:MAG: hypothetical protein HY554_00595, partial [Elusimicrobia bacterium]|nr:hypothetical protein [Elusimicrobiota bacterium]
LALGPHVIEYRARDFAGNFEAIKTSTFLVTAGGLSRVRGDLTVGGDLLVGYFDSGARFEVESRAENDYTLNVSSPDKTSLLAVDNIGRVSIGGNESDARLTLTPSTGSDAALSLRSGNSTSTWSSAQLAFGHDGSTLMRHAIKTQHHPSTVDGSENRMDFFLWTPAVSTATLGDLNVLSLRASTITAAPSVHIMPVGTPDADLEVSNGSCTGCGVIHVAQAFNPSSRSIKEGIEYLGQDYEESALRDLLGLRPVRFRYKRLDPTGRLVDDPASFLYKGLIYEEAPESIRGEREDIDQGQLISVLELALKASIRRMDELERRLGELKEGRP